ncbi:hypothetical protein BCR39DRAFT_511119 [Naematelia encephala]|uniref:PSP1 C-terminal domain-containing protein n=1 Tax=Naematelia encephala TaxID=71784 RepID=A0A1Y2BLG9_9TREE|nr:hypothetical protein BCR39DRAFT_511119 [Naematelia encephala]
MTSLNTHPPSATSSPNPQAPAFRPSPARAATLSSAVYPYKTRAASQPAGERLPAPASNPDSGRQSPSTNGAGAYGVIGGARTPGRFGSALATGGTTTRANSFSAGELREPRNPSLTRTLSSHAEELPSRSPSTSPFPTFSPNSSPSTSPATHKQQPLPHPHSPPKAGANVSRSRSQSLATGVRPLPDRGFMMPMSTLENNGAFPRFEAGWSNSPQEASNMSPFTRGLPHLAGQAGRLPSAHDTFLARNAWGSSAPERNNPNAALSSSVHKALGGTQQPAYTAVGGFGETTNGNRSGTSSRRHSVSVVGGPGGRRDFGFGDGMTMLSPPGRGLGPLAFTDAELLPQKLENALSLEIDQSRRRGIEIEAWPRNVQPQPIPVATSAPKYDPLDEESRHQRGNTFPRARGLSSAEPMPIYGSSPIRGRPDQAGLATDRAPSGESKDGSQKSRFSFENASPVTRSGPVPVFESPLRGRDMPPPGLVSRQGGPGPIGSPPNFDPRLPPFAPFQQAMYARPPGGFPAGSMGPPSPTAHFSRPPYGGYYGGAPRPPSFPPAPGYGAPSIGQPPFPPSSYPPAPTSPVMPTSPGPSFSSLSLSDLGKGVPLASLPPTTPLYIVTFKAGRRDVYYCPDPTLLISNGDCVIVEADRGSDLGTVIYDQLTPIDVREWQEKQATAALLSGASQHQPPGMAQATAQIPAKPRVPMNGGELAGADLSTLLSGAGPGGQPDMGGTTVRGPLAREVMPKRIFAKSSQGPEEQARMMDKLKDEYEAMMICREKVAQRGLPMQIVDAEYQWDRRKLTFYFKADKRVDFRDLTKENFRVFKSRIWMSMVPKDDPRC